MQFLPLLAHVGAGCTIAKETAFQLRVSSAGIYAHHTLMTKYLVSSAHLTGSGAPAHGRIGFLVLQHMVYIYSRSKLSMAVCAA